MTQPILDYASPQPKGRTRLPARSVLDLVEHEGGVRVIESLTGKGEAIGAICFALFTMFTLFLAWLDRHNRYGILESFALLELIVMTLVINNTWRRTIVDADPRELHLEFRAPIWPRRRGFVWPASDVFSVDVPSWPSARDTGARDARIAIVIRDAPPVSLFDGHVEPQLIWIAQRLRASLALAN